MAGARITRRPNNFYFARLGEAAPLDLATGNAAAIWGRIAALMTAATEIRVMEFDPGTPSSSEESESSYGDDQAFVFAGAETQGTASIQIIDATNADGRLTAAQAAMGKRVIDLANDGDIDIVRLRTTGIARLSTGAFPADLAGITDAIGAAAYYFRGKKRNARPVDGSPMDRYAFDIVQSQRFVRVEHSS